MSAVYACVYVRQAPVQALLRLRPALRDAACAVLEGEPPLQTVCSLNRHAVQMNMESGMTLVEAETFPGAVLLPRSLQEEAQAKAALLECAGRSSPSIEDVSTDNCFGCVLDISGTEKLLGPGATLAQELLRRTQALGLSAVVAVSSNFHTSLCLARGMTLQAPVQVIPPGEEQAALAPLPLAVLEMSDEQAKVFSLWGIQKLGDLAVLPEKGLIARMGQDGRRLRQLARGELPHLFRPVEAGFHLQESMELESPVELMESLLFIVPLMLEQLIMRAQGRALALAAVCLQMVLEGGGQHQRRVQPALPNNDKQAWLKLIQLDLDAHPPPAAVVELQMQAEPGSAAKVQMGLFSPQLPETMRLEVTLARLRSIVGEGNVGRAVLKDSHGPEAFRVESFTVPSGEAKQCCARPGRAAVRQVSPAEDVTVALHERQPKAFFFREKRYAVEHAYGPWKTSGDWWSTTLWGTEQWDVIARAPDGVLFCCMAHDLMRERWQLVALYD